jgi:hypothetical protein
MSCATDAEDDRDRRLLVWVGAIRAREAPLTLMHDMLGVSESIEIGVRRVW